MAKVMHPYVYMSVSARVSYFEILIFSQKKGNLLIFFTCRHKCNLNGL